jgi:hypothetical protein
VGLPQRDLKENKKPRPKGGKIDLKIYNKEKENNVEINDIINVF